MNNKDLFIIKKIVDYCEQIEEACRVFDASQEAFVSNTVFQNACCMCILQIGELAGKLSVEMQSQTPDIPWREIRGMRNICAHNYGMIDLYSTWATIEKDIPSLKVRCLSLL